MSTFLLATGSYDSSVRLFDAQNASQLRTFQFTDVAVLALAFSGAGPVHASTEPLYLAVGGSPRVAIYNASSVDTPGSPVFMFDGHTGPVTCVGFDPAIRPGFAYSASEDGTLQVWNPGLGRAATPRNGHANGQPNGLPAPSAPAPSTAEAVFVFKNKASVNAAAYDAVSKRFFTVDSEGHLKVWELGRSEPSATLTPRASRKKQHLQTLELTTDSEGAPVYLVLADVRGNVFIYTVASVVRAGADATPPVAQFVALDPPVRSRKVYVTRTKVSVDGSVLAVALSSGKVKVYPMATVIENGVAKKPEPTTTLPVNVPGHNGFIWDVVFVGDATNYIFTCGSDAQVILWNLDNGAPSDYSGHNKTVVCLAIKEQYSASGLVAAPLVAAPPEPAPTVPAIADDQVFTSAPPA